MCFWFQPRECNPATCEGLVFTIDPPLYTAKLKFRLTSNCALAAPHDFGFREVMPKGYPGKFLIFSVQK